MQIRIEGMTTRYGDLIAVDELDLSIRQGEMLVLLGPSGCGKTSTMRSIAGLETPAAGRIEIGDTTVLDVERGIDVPVHKRRTGMVFQSYAIWPHMTVFENVAFPLKMQRTRRSEIRERVDAALDLVGLGGTGARGASLLSGGQMQRVALARSLVMRPKVLLLDEPLSNLDARLRDQLRFDLKELQQELGLTSVYVTHDQSEALALADRIAVMDAGRIVQLDEPVRIYTEPSSSFVADFLGVKNIFPGVLATTAAGGPPSVQLEGSSVSFRVVPDATDLTSGRVNVCIRPEAMELILSGREAPQTGDNVWAGTVQVASYLGTHTRYHVELAGGGPVVEVVSYDTDQIAERDEHVHVRLAPEGVRLLELNPTERPSPSAAAVHSERVKT